MTAQHLIEAEQLNKSFGSESALRQIQLQVKQGEFVSIVGPSGCGKSTLLRMVAALDAPTSGTIRVAGASPQEIEAEGHRVAFVFQDPTLLPWRTVSGNIQLPLELHKVPSPQRKAKVERSLEMIGLSHQDARKLPKALSGGMRMRVSLARALVTDPTILLLDEPFAALDDMLRQQLNEELVGLWRQKEWTTLFVTHNVAEAVFMSQRVLIMSGRPGTMVDQVDVPLPYPRVQDLRGTAEFANLTGQVSDSLRKGGS